MRDFFKINDSGKLLVSRDAIIDNEVYTKVSYKSGKSKGRFVECVLDGCKYVLLESLPESTRRLVVSKMNKINSEYSKLLLMAQGSGSDSSQIAVEFTAESLRINELFMRSEIMNYMNVHNMYYLDFYMDLGLSSKSLRGYAKQCSLVQWVYNFAQQIRSSEADAKRCALLMRSFRMNLLTSLENIDIGIKIPLSESRFGVWFDNIIRLMDSGAKPHDIIQVKRKNNGNACKVSSEQLDVALYWYTNGTNMSVSQIYKKWLQEGKDKGWWVKGGVYLPPSESRLYQLLQPHKNSSLLEKTDSIEFRKLVVPTVNRLMPEKKNDVWVIDATAHNENVEHNGKVRQHIYTCAVIDAATYRQLGCSSVIGAHETFGLLRDAILSAIFATGYKPYCIQCDRGPAWKELEVWCSANDIKLYASGVGNARSKPIEQFFNMRDDKVVRYLSGYSGKNRTAVRSVTSRSSEKREKFGKQNARSVSIAMEWLKTDCIRLWNESVMDTFNRRPCGQTPQQLWDSKESRTPQLSHTQLSRLCGTLHERKLTNDGLSIEHNRKGYVYFPPFSTHEERTKAVELFSRLPRQADTTNRLKIYVLEGGKPSPVFDHKDKFLGIWGLKPDAAFIAETDAEKAIVDNFIALQYRIKEHAKKANLKVKRAIEMNPDFERIEQRGKLPLAAISGDVAYESFAEADKRFSGRYDKVGLLTGDLGTGNVFKVQSSKVQGSKVQSSKVQSSKAQGSKVQSSMVQGSNVQGSMFKEVVDPDTGEIIRIFN